MDDVLDEVSFQLRLELGQVKLRAELEVLLIFARKRIEYCPVPMFESVLSLEDQGKGLAFAKVLWRIAEKAILDRLSELDLDVADNLS